MSKRVLAIALAAVAVAILYRLRRAALAPAPLSAEPAPEDLSPAVVSPEGPPRAELYREAQRLDVPGRSTMNKAELGRAIEQVRREGGSAA